MSKIRVRTKVKLILSLKDVKLIQRALELYSYDYSRLLIEDVFPFPDAARSVLSDSRLLADYLDFVINSYELRNDNLPF